MEGRNEALVGRTRIPCGGGMASPELGLHVPG